MDNNNGEKFTTFDVDNEGWSLGNCAVKRRGAWWYWRCSYSNLNGVYHLSASAPDRTGIYWHDWKNNVDNNGWSGGNCAVKQRGAWWYWWYSYSNLNGVYHLSASAPDRTGIYWHDWHGWKNNVDNNGWSHGNCAVKQRGAWWYWW